MPQEDAEAEKSAAQEDDGVKEAEAEETEESEEPGNEEVANRLFKGFHNVFGRHGGKRSAEKQEEPEKEAEPVVPEAAETAETAVPEEKISDAVPVYEKQPERKQSDFNLDAFLQEMEGSISEEILTGEYKAREVEPVMPDLEELPLSGTQELLAAMDAAEAAEAGNSPEELPENAEEAHVTAAESIQAAVEGVVPPEIVQMRTEELAAKAEPAKKKPKYNEELEIPDEEPTEEEKKAHTIPLGTIGQNTVPISIDKILSSETAEEQRIRILNNTRPTRMNEEQRKTFTYFARIPGMDTQILEAISSVYEHAGERTSLHGNIGVMGAKGTGKTRLSHGLIVTMCKDMDLSAVKVARIKGDDLNKKDPAKIVNLMAGGFLTIEDISHVNEQTLAKLNQAMEFRTDCMIVIIEDEKTAMRAFLKDNPTFAAKFEKMISIPVFTNDELVTFARTYAAENDCQLDDLAILALYTKIGNQQSEENPITISVVRDMVDSAIDRAAHGKRRSKRVGRRGETSRMTILHEKDFE